jgi:quercetin 2,3-dioxygenase
MFRKRPADARGGGDYGWLNTRHTCSFNDDDPEYMGFRVLRVINEDRVQPGQGVGTHSHRDMEIVTYVVEGRWRTRTAWAPARCCGPASAKRVSEASP